MNWTKEKPSKEGWYWFSCRYGVSCQYVTMVGARLAIQMPDGEAVDFDQDFFSNGVWSNEPIPLPDDAVSEQEAPRYIEPANTARLLDALSKISALHITTHGI